MAVTVDFKEKKKKQKVEDKSQTAPVAPPTDLSDYVLSEDRSEGLKALAIWAGTMLFIVFVFLAISATAAHKLGDDAPDAGSVSGTRALGIGVLLWWILSILGYFFVGPRMVQRRLNLEPESEITAKTNPRLKTLLAKGSALIGVDEPVGYLIDEGIPQVTIMGSGPPYFIVVSKAAVALLQAPELDCLALRCLVHARQGHVRRLMLLRFLNDTPAPLRAIAWPANFYALMLRMMWQDYAEQTADRLTLLLMKNPKLLLSALLKIHAATDPLMQEANISPQDVESYVKQAGAIGAGGEEISTQYKLGSAIQENPYLEERIKELTAWSKSPEYHSALDKLAAARAEKTGGMGVPPPPGPPPGPPPTPKKK